MTKLETKELYRYYLGIISITGWRVRNVVKEAWNLDTHPKVREAMKEELFND